MKKRKKCFVIVGLTSCSIFMKYFDSCFRIYLDGDKSDVKNKVVDSILLHLKEREAPLGRYAVDAQIFDRSDNYIEGNKTTLFFDGDSVRFTEDENS